MTHKIIVFFLLLGLIGLISAIAIIRERITQGYSISIGSCVLIGAFLAAMPLILIELEVIEKTLATVGLAIFYFLVFVVGSALTSLKAYEREHDQKIK